MAVEIKRKEYEDGSYDDYLFVDDIQMGIVAFTNSGDKQILIDIATRVKNSMEEFDVSDFIAKFVEYMQDDPTLMMREFSGKQQIEDGDRVYNVDFDAKTVFCLIAGGFIDFNVWVDSLKNRQLKNILTNLV